MSKTIISHIRQTDMAIQPNDDHQRGVAERAEHFAAEFGMGEWGRILGLLHDKGKEKLAFQQHIIKESGIDPSIHVDGDFNHAYVGALLASKLFRHYAPLMINALAGHHRGLYDHGDLMEALKANIPEEVKIEELPAKFEMPKGIQPSDLHHLQRFLYSCLTDADYLDTESFMKPDQYQLRKDSYDLHTLELQLESYLHQLSENAPNTEVNKIRVEVQGYCRMASQGTPGFYNLTVPTGGGKTLSSILWALKHAVKNNMKRVIIVIPYTSIITQTAEVLRNIFGDENVLEHHSEVDDKHDDQIRKLATENWNYPIVVTTNVQLFESLFSNKPSDCRKLHNIARSVLIMDEVQTLPVNYLRPITDTLSTLQRIFGVSMLFTTASQPVLTGKIMGTNKLNSFNALPIIQEIIPPGTSLHQRLRRTSLSFDTDRSSYDDVAERLSRHKRVLCIVNTRQDAREIFSRLPEEGYRLHLSRMMCPEHVKAVIRHIKELLKSEVDIPVRVVATQLIEAGVDIDFPVVFRQEAGLDSVLQAAGRCNREGKLAVSATYVFSLQKALPPGHITQTNNARLGLGSDRDWFAPETMTSYFQQLYSRVDDFDKPKIKELLYKPEFQFETASKAFHLIDDNTTSVIVNWKNSMDLVAKLKEEGISYHLMKQLSRYIVNVRQRDLQLLLESGAIEEVMDDIYVVASPSFYNKEVGLITINQWLEETLIL